MNIDNKKKDILILGKGSTQGLDDTSTQGLDDTVLAAEVQYSINFSTSNGKLC